MKGRFFLATILVALGACVLMTPTIFPVCDAHIPTASGGQIPMKCFWTGRMTVALGATLTFGGIVLCVCSNAAIRLGVALLLIPVNIVLLLTPTVLIGVCPGEMMPCHMGTLPAITLFGSLGLLAALLGVVLFRREQRRSRV